MPCYLFTYHAYLSWLPDRKRGYTHRGQGILPPDPDMADRYRRNAKESPVSFEPDSQKIMIEEVLIAAKFQRFTVDSIGTDPSHLHLLNHWRDEREFDVIRNGLRSSLTRRLNRDFGKRTWFSESASRKRVLDQEHFDYLVVTYLPDHPGWKWSSERGLYLDP